MSAEPEPATDPSPSGLISRSHLGIEPFDLRRPASVGDAAAAVADGAWAHAGGIDVAQRLRAGEVVDEIVPCAPPGARQTSGLNGLERSRWARDACSSAPVSPMPASSRTHWCRRTDPTWRPRGGRSATSGSEPPARSAATWRHSILATTLRRSWRLPGQRSSLRNLMAPNVAAPWPTCPQPVDRRLRSAARRPRDL